MEKTLEKHMGPHGTYANNLRQLRDEGIPVDVSLHWSSLDDGSNIM